MHEKISKEKSIFGIFLLILGIVYLIVDLSLFNWDFWGIQWYTSLLIGTGAILLFAHKSDKSY